MNALEFLDALFGTAPEGHKILIWTLPDKRSHWFDRPVDAALAAQELAPVCDVYVGVGLHAEDLGPDRRGTSADISGIAAMWCDIDLHSEAHPRDKLPPTATDALSLIPAGMPPTFVIFTGNGVHAWWVFREVWTFDSPAERERAALLASRWQTLLRLNAAAKGWTFDRLADLARVLRVPQSVNHKDPAHPKQVVATQWNPERRYTPSDIEELLDSLGIPDAEAAKKAAGAWADRFAETPITIDTTAQFPPDMIQTYCDVDARFANTWDRRRHDLKDDTQSGYDMALAMFGVEAGLAAQQIVDLMITHRNKHGKRHRTLVEYYQRTIAKAMETVEARGPVPAVQAPASAPASPQGAAPAAAAPTLVPVDPGARKAQICEELGETLGLSEKGIAILRILKVRGKDPTYHIELNVGTVELASATKILDYGAFASAIFAETNFLIKPIKPKDWRELINAKISDAMTETDGGEETSLKGSTRFYLDAYLTEVKMIPEIAGQPAHKAKRPTVLDPYPSQIAISSTDFSDYLSKTHNQKLTSKTVASMLTSIGCTHVRARGKHREQPRWLLPAGEFSPKQYEQIHRDEEAVF